MKPITWIITLLLLTSTPCWAESQPPESATTIASHLLARQPEPIRDYLSASILALIPLDPAAEKELEAWHPESPLRSLLKAHVQYRHQLITKRELLNATRQFHEWKTLFSLHETSGYPFDIPPLVIRDIADIGGRDPLALRILLSAYRQSDGAFREQIFGLMSGIYSKHPEWFSGNELSGLRKLFNKNP